MCVGPVRNLDRGDNYLHSQNSPLFTHFHHVSKHGYPSFTSLTKAYNIRKQICKAWSLRSAYATTWPNCTGWSEISSITGNYTLNSQICKTKSKNPFTHSRSLNPRLTWPSNNFKRFINIMWEPVRNSARGDGHLPPKIPCLPILIMLNSKEYPAFPKRQLLLCSIRQSANKYRNLKFWYPWSALDQPMPSHNQIA